jgi:two-component system aerobic respiration control sensor histidine kinase ArcB
MTGFDIAKYYREKYSELPPLVALTANVLNNKKEYLNKGMDDAISKPLSVKAIQDVIAKLIESEQPDKPQVIEEAQVVEPKTTSIDTSLLDIEMLESYVDIVGPKPVLDSIAMFEDMMPDYMDILNSNMVAKDQANIVSEAHKIKGAAGSIGLKRIQQVAQKAQSPDLPAWWENISDWVDEINNEYQNDIEVLKSWLNQR